MNNSVLPVTIQNKKLVINNGEEYYTATQCFKLIEFFKGLGWDEDDLLIYQANMSNTIGPPIYNIDHILLRTYRWLYPIYGKNYSTDLSKSGKTYIGNRSETSESQKEFPWSESDMKLLFKSHKPYYYLSYNGQLRPHRQYILNELFKRNIVEKGLVSCLHSPTGNGFHKEECENQWTNKQSKECCGGDPNILWGTQPHGERSDTIDGIRDFLKLSHKPQDKELFPCKEFISSIPMILDIKPDGVAKSVPTEDFNLNEGEFQSHRTSDVRHFKDSYFSLVTESEFLSDDIDEDHDYRGEVMFITEKTYRALCFHPTIIAGNKGILKYLRELGFKTFPNFFDESYDDIENDHDRIFAVVNEVERICKLSVDEVHKMAKESFDIVLHNQRIMKEYGNPHFSLTELGSIYEDDFFDQ
tara:strand:+ start:1582 stop:2823 length:1242 start_codon:yes stop_codon:yes gene_type:complete